MLQNLPRNSGGTLQYCKTFIETQAALCNIAKPSQKLRRHFAMLQTLPGNSGSTLSMLQSFSKNSGDTLSFDTINPIMQIIFYFFNILSLPSESFKKN
jgi:hypothetical protein